MILEQVGVRFAVVEPDVEELEQGSAKAVTVENARRKARAVAARYPREVVLGVDTVVELDGTIYGKPADLLQARETLETLSGRTHEVLSGVCVIDSGNAAARPRAQGSGSGRSTSACSSGTSRATSGASGPGDTRSRGAVQGLLRGSTATI